MNRETILQFRKEDKVKILSIECEKKFSQRLCALGIFEGSEILILKNDNFGPVILKILNSKIALARDEANKIYAEKL